MTTATQELEARRKTEVADRAEQTRPGRVFTPAVDILEHDDAMIIVADVPGVDSDGLTIDLREDVLTLTAAATASFGAGEAVLLQEYETGTYYRQFRLPNTIEQSKIDATLTDGVLRLVLPKAESSRPRKIAVKAS